MTNPAPAGGTILHQDGLRRCPWAGLDPLYMAYHDEEWGVPERDSRALFEKLLLDGFQAGLSWITILRKRDAFRRAFDDFDPEKIAAYDETKIASLMNDSAIVRNRAKILAAPASAKAYLRIEKREGFAQFLWRFVGDAPIQNSFAKISEAPTQTDISLAMSKTLKAEGFKFCGPTIVYAFMQAVGMVNDHLVDCHCHRRDERALSAPASKPRNRS